MKYFGLITTWAVAIALSLSLRGAGTLQADPTDDFSFTLMHAPQAQAYRLMPVSRVTTILQDHLDAFPHSEAPKLARHLLQLCRQYRFDPAFVVSLIQVESRFRVRVVSPYGAVGLMQVMPATALKVARDLGLNLRDAGWGLRSESAIQLAERALRDPYFNLSIGVAYLAYLRDHYHGKSPYYLVAAYNVGPARMDELLSRPSFKPVTTKKYYEDIRKHVPHFRFYKREARRARRTGPGEKRWYTARANAI